MRKILFAASALALALPAHGPSPVSAAPEICGNNADEDGDGHLDEGCNPESYLKVRESPLPARAVGTVSPLKGQEIWSEPPDFDIATAFGPRLTFLSRAPVNEHVSIATIS